MHDFVLQICSVRCTTQFLIISKLFKWNNKSNVWCNMAAWPKQIYGLLSCFPSGYFCHKSVPNYWLNLKWLLGVIVMFCHIVSDKNNAKLLMKTNVQILFPGQKGNVVGLMVMIIINRSNIKKKKKRLGNLHYLFSKQENSLNDLIQLVVSPFSNL